MTRLRSFRRGAPTLVVGLAVLLTCLAGTASAQTRPRFRRGHLPSIGEIRLVKAGGRAEVIAPSTYTQALSGHPVGLEYAEVTVRIAAGLGAGGNTGDRLTRVHRQEIHGSGTIVAHFRLDARDSRRLLGLPRKERGRLVRIDVRHQIKPHRGSQPLHEKDASLTMASSHQARSQGEAEFLAVHPESSPAGFSG